MRGEILADRSMEACERAARQSLRHLNERASLLADAIESDRRAGVTPNRPVYIRRRAERLDIELQAAVLRKVLWQCPTGC